MNLETPFRTVTLALILAAATSAHAGGDPARGADLFKQNCSACHSPERGQNLIGPSLYSVVGRNAASVANFSYSSAMKDSGVVWTEDRLMVYLKAPRRYIPGVKMMFPGLEDQQDRENVIAFLETLRDGGAPSNMATSQVPSPRTSRVSN